MEDAIIVTLLIRWSLAVLFALVGGWCVYLGTRLLLRRVGGATKSSFEATIGGHKLAFTAGAAGTAVTFVSTAWLAGAVWAVPTFTQGPQGTTVAFGPELKARTGIGAVSSLKFEGDATALTPQQKFNLDKFLAQWRAGAGSQKIFVESRAATGQREFDLAIAQKRSQAVTDYIIEKGGLNPSVVETQSYGEELSTATRANENYVVLTAEWPKKEK